jgi:hypothetical protein
MSWLRYSIIFSIIALIIESIGIVWALNQYRMLEFGDDRLEYWLNYIVILFVFLLVRTAFGFLFQVIAYRRLNSLSKTHA